MRSMEWKLAERKHMTSETENLSQKLKDSNPFDAVGSLMSAIAASPASGNNSRRTYENAIRSHQLEPVEVREEAITLFRECAGILELPFLPMHQAAIELHHKFVIDIREAFYPMVATTESMNSFQAFISLWDEDRWAILSLSVRSFRNEYQNRQLIEFVKRYLSLLLQLLNESEKNETVTDALEILANLLNSLDEDLWKSSWEEYAHEFAVLDGLLRTESEENPDSPLSTFYRSTRETVWKVIYQTNRVTDAILFVPKAYAVLNIGIALLSSDALSTESIRIVEDFMRLLPQLALPEGGSNAVPTERNVLPESTVAPQVE